MRIDADHVSLGPDMFLNLPDAERQIIVARARENSVARDGCGLDAQPRETIKSVLREAFQELELEKQAKARPPKFTEAELELIELERAAFGKKSDAPLKGQAALVKHYQAQGMTPKDAAAKAAQRAAAWRTSLGSITPGRNPHKAALKAAEAEAEKSAKKKDDDGMKVPRGENPWAAGQFNVTKQAKIVSAMGWDKASQIAAAVGCKIGDTKPRAVAK